MDAETKRYLDAKILELKRWVLNVLREKGVGASSGNAQQSGG